MTLSVANAVRMANVINHGINDFADAISDANISEPIVVMKGLINEYLESLMGNGIYDYAMLDDLDGGLLISVYASKTTEPIQWTITLNESRATCTRHPL